LLIHVITAGFLPDAWIRRRMIVRSIIGLVVTVIVVVLVLRFMGVL